METIRNYLNAMFAGLPDTPEVRRAYEELAAMMEDKYTELIGEGHSENEAVGTVISEFGNLEELAQTLGIEDCLNDRQERSGDSAESAGSRQNSAGPGSGPDPQRAYSEPQRRIIQSEEICGYLGVGGFAGFLKSFGVLLCITSPVGVVLLGDLNAGQIGEFFENFGVALFFVFIAAAVACFSISRSYMKPWAFMKTEACTLDGDAGEIVADQEKEFAKESSRMKMAGILLCILSVVPVILFGERFGVAMFFVFVGVGVLLFVYRGARKSLFKQIRNAEARGTSAGGKSRRYVRVEKQDKIAYSDRNLQSVMSVYWQLVTCVYLGFSFLTGTWGISWILWIIAGIVKKLIEDRYGHPSENF